MTDARRRLLRGGILSALVLYLSLSVFQVFAVAPFLTADESPHVDYALQVWHGHLPIAGRSITDTPIPGMPVREQFVANHPPLYHAIVGSVLRLGVATDHAVAGLYLARLITSAFTAGTIVLVGAIAYAVGGRRRNQLAVASAALVGVFSPLVFASGTVQNDSLAAFFAAAILYLLVLVLQRGATARRMWLLCGACAAGTLTRATVFSLVALTAAALVLGALVAESAAPWRERIRRGFGRAFAVVGAAVVASGWFYLLNVHRYGDPLGGNAVYAIAAKRRREPNATSLISYLTDPGAWTMLWRQGFGGRNSRLPKSPGYSATLSWIVGVLVVVGCLFAIVQWIRHRSTNRAPLPDSSSRITRLLRVVIGLSLVACVVEVASHVTHLGTPHGRYLAPGIVGYAVGVAAALLAIPVARHTAAWFVALVAHTWAVLGFDLVILRRVAEVKHLGWLPALSRSLAINNVPAAPVVLTVLLGTAGAALVVLVLVVARLDRWSGAEGARVPVSG